jgi:mxaL protein
MTRRQLEPAMLLLAALLLAAALFGPTLPGHVAVVEELIVLDVTQSMNVPDAPLDVTPVARLVAAKAMLADALQELPCGSKIGWGAVTEYRAFVLLAPVEVCANRRELLTTLGFIDGKVAWSGNSEIAKGLGSALRAARELPGKPSIVFVTDGHEAPPINAHYRPRIDVPRGEIGGLIVGVGGDRPQAIPTTDPSGNPLGVWRADDVLQIDPRSRGRGGSVENEAMAGDEEERAGAVMIGATPGSEHLSSLRESYLRLLADDTGLLYHRLHDREALRQAIVDPQLAHLRESPIDMRPWLGATALLALLIGTGLLAPASWRRGGASA